MLLVGCFITSFCLVGWRGCCCVTCLSFAVGKGVLCVRGVVVFSLLFVVEVTLLILFNCLLGVGVYCFTTVAYSSGFVV